MKNPNYHGDANEESDGGFRTDVNDFIDSRSFGAIGYPLLPLKKRIFKSETDKNDSDDPQNRN